MRSDCKVTKTRAVSRTRQTLQCNRRSGSRTGPAAEGKASFDQGPEGREHGPARGEKIGRNPSESQAGHPKGAGAVVFTVPLNTWPQNPLERATPRASLNVIWTLSDTDMSIDVVSSISAMLLW